MVCCLFCNFAGLFDFGCCSLAQEMSFVNHSSTNRTCPISGSGLSPALLPFQPLFTECSCSDYFLAPTLFSGVFSVSCPLCRVLVFSLLFIVQEFFFAGGVGKSAQGIMLV
jgi:hypothetical protein